MLGIPVEMIVTFLSITIVCLGIVVAFYPFFWVETQYDDCFACFAVKWVISAIVFVYFVAGRCEFGELGVEADLSILVVATSVVVGFAWLTYCFYPHAVHNVIIDKFKLLKESYSK